MNRSAPHASPPIASRGPERFGLATLASLLEESLDGIVVLDETGRFVYANPASCTLFGRSHEDVLGRSVADVVVPRLQERLRENLRRSIAGDAGRRSTVVVRPDGSEREVEYTSMYLQVEGETLVAGIMRDVTVAHRREREATALARMAANLTLDQSIGVTLDALVASVVEATGAEACVIGLVSPESLELRAMAVHGFPMAYAREMEARWPTAVARGTNAAMAFQLQVQRILPDARSGTLADPNMTHLHEYLREAAWDIAVFTPIVYRGRSLGILNSYYPSDPSPGEPQLALLRALAGQAAVAVENANLFYEAQEKATLEEPQRLARELHDSVSQALYGIALGAKTARSMLERDPARAVEPLDYVLSLAQAGLTEMRALIFELRPEMLEQDGIVVTLEKQANALRTRHMLAVDVDLGDEPAIPLEIKQALYRIAQEALHNTVKHAKASRVELRLAIGIDGVTLDVRDDGAGFNRADAFPGHFGLRSIQERATRLGGQAEIASAPGAGTEVKVWVPLRRSG